MRRQQNITSANSQKANGSAKRRLGSWIDRFVGTTNGLESPEIFRKWAAITTIAAALEQKVYLQTSSQLHPNIYCFIVAHPGVGKTRTIRACSKYYEELPEHHLSPTSMTGAAMVDAMKKRSRAIVMLPDPPLEYNSMFITADELGAFMHKYDEEAIAMMSAFYDNHPYGQERRGNDVRIKIKRPQLNIIAGTTPANLLKFMPENSWEQGFTSRIIMVFSDERTIGDDFAGHSPTLDEDLTHDLKSINNLMGKFEVTQEYKDAVGDWRQLGEPPIPSHPKLIHYASRRRVHLYKLSMVSAVDRSDVLLLTKADFNRAMGWLLEAESAMPDIFKAGAGNADAQAMDEIFHYVVTLQGPKLNPVPEFKIVKFARERIPIHSVMRVVEIMEKSGQIVMVGYDKRLNQRMFVAQSPGSISLVDTSSPGDEPITVT